MIAEKLRKAVLQAATQGKLTQQLLEDGNAKDLFKQIEEKRKELSEEGVIRPQKPLPEITEAEIPYGIPDNWIWVRLGDLCSLITDGTHKTPKYVKKGIPFLSIQNISSGRFDFSTMKFITEEEHRELTRRTRPELNDILLCRIGTLGKPIVVNLDFEFSIFVSLALIKPLLPQINTYLVHYLSSPGMDQWIEENKVGGGTHTNKLNLGDLSKLPIPLPPYKEQLRINMQLDSALPRIDKLIGDESKLDAIQKAFPQRMRNSILQHAMEGKLTDQRPEDGNASDLLEIIRNEKAKLIKEGKLRKQKPLPAIAEEEVPYGIPESWAWVRLGDIGQVVGGGTPKTSVSKYWSGGTIPWLTPADMRNVRGKLVYSGNRFITEAGLAGSSAQLLPEGSVVFSSRAPIGYIAIAGNELATNQGFKSIIPFESAMSDYVYYAMMAATPAIQAKGTGTTFKEVSGSVMSSIVIPLPPLVEQHRIIKRLEELLPLCESLD